MGQALACSGLQPAHATNLRHPAAAKYYLIVHLTHRRLPHLYGIGEPLFVTFRLHNTLPPKRDFPARLSSGKAFVCMDRILDGERTGPSYLRMPAIANVVAGSILCGSPGDYALHAWVLMPKSRAPAAHAEGRTTRGTAKAEGCFGS